MDPVVKSPLSFKSPCMYLNKCYLQGSSTSTLAGASSRFVVPTSLLGVVAFFCIPKQMKELHINIIASK